MPEPWGRQDGESERAFAAFLAYRDLGAERTVCDAYRQSAGKPEAKQAPGTWNKWAKDRRWKERALAWDRHLLGKEAAGAGRVAEQDGEKWAGRRKVALDHAFEAAERLLLRAYELSAFPVERVTNDGGKVTVEPIGAHELRAATATATAAFELMMSVIDRALPPEEILPDGFDPATETDPVRLRAFLESGGRRVG
ncbi:hypothetical protein AB1L88_15545 [Tautonia sp. JC769]|uniref:hypothetical protein n=1 Tax=Tautonia sp. JC769 TaxID=3232135 RepID=UPI0034599FE0